MTGPSRRPASFDIVRGGQRIPIELSPMPGEYADGYEHWSAATALAPNDTIRAEALRCGVVVHFTNGYLVRAGLNSGDVAFFRSEPQP